MGIVSILIDARINDLAADGERLLTLHVHRRRNKQHVAVAQRHIRRRAVEKGIQVDALHLQRAVLIKAVHHGARSESILAQSSGSLQQGTYALYVASQLILTSMHHGTSHLHHILEACHHAIHIDAITIAQRETPHLELVNGVHAVLCASLARQTNVAGIGIASEATGILQHLLHALAGLHLVEHGALHLAAYTNQRLVGSHKNHIVVLQTHIARRIAVQQIVVNVKCTNLATLPENSDVAQRAHIADAAGVVQSVESAAQAAKRVGARHSHLAQHMHLYAAVLAQREAYLAVLIILPKGLFHACRRLTDAQSCQSDGTHALNHHCAVGRYRTLESLLSRAPYVDDDGIASSQHIVGGSSHVLPRLKGEQLVVEDIPAEHLRAALPVQHVLIVEQ